MHEFKDSNKKVFLMSLPIFVELLLQLLVGNIDQVMLSHISQSDVAAIGNANQITNIIVIAMELLSSAALNSCRHICSLCRCNVRSASKDNIFSYECTV